MAVSAKIDSKKSKIVVRSVKLTEQQVHHLERQAAISGKSVSSLIREACFSGGIQAPLMTKDDMKVLLGQLGRIGNNVNQIAKALNYGFRAGFHDEIVEVRESLQAVYAFLMSFSDNKKKKKAHKN